LSDFRNNRAIPGAPSGGGDGLFEKTRASLGLSKFMLGDIHFHFVGAGREDRDGGIIEGRVTKRWLRGRRGSNYAGVYIEIHTNA
jgi:hypothetical protein